MEFRIGRKPEGISIQPYGMVEARHPSQTEIRSAILVARGDPDGPDGFGLLVDHYLPTKADIDAKGDHCPPLPN